MSPSAHPRANLAVLFILLASAPALAQPAKDAGQAAYEEGRRFYDLREWDHAIAKFKEAYRLRSDARSLFNIAQAYRLKGDCVEAVNFYKTFHRNFPAERAAASAAKFIEELESCRAQQASQAGTPDPEPAPPPPTGAGTPATAEPAPVAAPGPRAPAAGGRALRLAGIVTGGVGLAAIGTGVYFGTQASAREDELAGATVWDQELFDRGTRADRNAKLMFVFGGLATIGGAALYYLGRRAGSEPQLAVIPADGGGSMVWSCAF